MDIENEQPEYDFHIYYHITGKYVNLSINKYLKHEYSFYKKNFIIEKQKFYYKIVKV